MLVEILKYIIVIKLSLVIVFYNDDIWKFYVTFYDKSAFQDETQTMLLYKKYFNSRNF